MTEMNFSKWPVANENNPGITLKNDEWTPINPDRPSLLIPRDCVKSIIRAEIGKRGTGANPTGGSASATNYKRSEGSGCLYLTPGRWYIHQVSGADIVANLVDALTEEGARFFKVPGFVAPRHGFIDLVGGSLEILPCDPNRRYALIINDKVDQEIYLKLGVAAALNEGIRLNRAGGNKEFMGESLWTGQIFGINTGAAARALFTEGF